MNPEGGTFPLPACVSVCVCIPQTSVRTVCYRPDAAVPDPAAPGDRAEGRREGVQHGRRQALQVVALLLTQEVHGQVARGPRTVTSTDPAPVKFSQLPVGRTPGLTVTNAESVNQAIKRCSICGGVVFITVSGDVRLEREERWFGADGRGVY